MNDLVVSNTLKLVEKLPNERVLVFKQRDFAYSLYEEFKDNTKDFDRFHYNKIMEYFPKILYEIDPRYKKFISSDYSDHKIKENLNSFFKMTYNKDSYKKSIKKFFKNRHINHNKIIEKLYNEHTSLVVKSKRFERRIKEKYPQYYKCISDKKRYSIEKMGSKYYYISLGDELKYTYIKKITKKITEDHEIEIFDRYKGLQVIELKTTLKYIRGVSHDKFKHGTQNVYFSIPYKNTYLVYVGIIKEIDEKFDTIISDELANYKEIKSSIRRKRLQITRIESDFKKTEILDSKEEFIKKIKRKDILLKDRNEKNYFFIDELENGLTVLFNFIEMEFNKEFVDNKEEYDKKMSEYASSLLNTDSDILEQQLKIGKYRETK